MRGDAMARLGDYHDGVMAGKRTFDRKAVRASPVRGVSSVVLTGELCGGPQVLKKEFLIGGGKLPGPEVQKGDFYTFTLNGGKSFKNRIVGGISTYGRSIGTWRRGPGSPNERKYSVKKALAL